MNTEATGDTQAGEHPADLKIAETPHDDSHHEENGTAVESPDNQTEPAADAAPAGATKKPRRAKGVRRLTPEQMDREMERVDRANGKPGIAHGTHPEDSAAADATNKASAPAPSDNGQAAAGDGKSSKGKAKKSSKRKGGNVKTAAAEPPHETKEQHHARRVREAKDRLCEISMEHQAAVELTKRLKKQRDNAITYLHDLQEDGPEELPLIDAADKAKTAAGGASSNGEAEGSQKRLPLDGAGASASSSAESQSVVWRDVSIGGLGEFGMSVRTHKALIEQNKIETLGALAGFSNENHGRLVKLKGIGKAAAEQLQDALDKFWKKNPQLVPAEKATASEQSASTQTAETSGTNGSKSKKAAKKAKATKKSARKKPAAKKTARKKNRASKNSTAKAKPRRR